MRRWGLVLADFRREYHLGEADVAALSLRELRYLLAGLSARSVLREALAGEARMVDNDTAAQLLGG